MALFFKQALGLDNQIEGNNFSGHSKAASLRDAFVANKNALAYLFSLEGGLDNFAGCIGSLGDGCVANIATQAKMEDA